MGLKRRYEGLQESIQNAGSTENLGVGLQRKLASINTRSKFDFFLPDLVHYWTTSGGIEALVIPDDSPIEERNEVCQTKS